jgi:hypothetical protein
MAKSYPWWKLWFEDLDRDCGALSLATRGAWVWILGNIRNLGGERSLDLEGWARLIGASPNQTAIVLTELINADICDAKITCNANVTDLSHTSVTQLSQSSSAIVTLINRRIAREFKKRTANSLRQQRRREKSRCSTNVTTLSHHKEAEAEAYTPITPTRVTHEQHKNGNGNGAGKLSLDSKFLILFEAYPAHRRGKRFEAEKTFSKLNPDDDLFGKILASIDELKQSDSWMEKAGKFIPGIEKFIEGKQWEVVQLKDCGCPVCDQTGVVVRKNGELLPWTIERECNGGLPYEICPKCKGKNRISAPGLPNVKFT